MAPPKRYQSSDFKRSLCHNPLFFVKCCQTFIISQWSFFFRCEWSYKPVTWMTGHACRTWNPQEGRGGRVWQATNLWLSEGLAITQDFHTSGSLVREAFKNVLADFVKKPLADRGGTPPP